MRKKITVKIKSKLLIANRHSCCICCRGNVQIHHINGDNSDNAWDNLAVLCLPHHNKATAPKDMTASLKPNEIKTYKRDWEEKCKILSHNLARSRNSFFMVDYKNAERIRQLFEQLTVPELEEAYWRLRTELIEEDKFRKEQGFDRSIEPNTGLNQYVIDLVEAIKQGNPHPNIFKNTEFHPKDPFYPKGPAFANFKKPLYDIWCQIMIRTLILTRGTYDLDNLAEIYDPKLLSLNGNLIAFSGKFKGKAYAPDKYEKYPTSTIRFTFVGKKSTWKSNMNIKTHYVYSDTAAMSLESNHLSGLFLLRKIDKIIHLKSKYYIQFSCTPLIIGSGDLKIE